MAKSVKNNDSTFWYKRFLAGTCSGIGLTLVGHPLDTLKVRMQIGLDKSLVAATSSLWKSEGVKGFYRGMLVPLSLTGAVNTVLFGMQFNLEPYFSGGTPPGVKHAMQAAVVSGCLISVLVTPMELVKSRLQVIPKELRRGPIQMYRDIFRAHGIGGMYRGWSAVVLARASNFAYFQGLLRNP